MANRNAVRTAAAPVRSVQVDRLAVNSHHFVGVDEHQAIGQVIVHLFDAGPRRLVCVGSSLHVFSAADRVVRSAIILDPDLPVSRVRLEAELIVREPAGLPGMTPPALTRGY